MFFFKKKKEKVKVVDSFKDALPNEVFRLKEDSPNVLRFQPERQKEYTLYGQGIGSGEPVKGTSYREETCLKFIKGKNRKLEAEYASAEEEFPGAIKIMGIWEDKDGEHREHIGYADKEISKEIHEKYDNLPIDAELRTIYLPEKGKNLGIRMFLLRAKNPKRFEK